METHEKLMLINPKELQQQVLDYIGSDEFEEMVNNTVFKDDSQSKQAIAHGMAVASMMTSQCKLYCVEEILEPVCENLIFLRPRFLKKEKVIDEFNLDFKSESKRTSIYQNEDVRFSFDKKIIRVLLYNRNNTELKRKIENYFYKKEWKAKKQF